MFGFLFRRKSSAVERNCNSGSKISSLQIPPITASNQSISTESSTNSKSSGSVSYATTKTGDPYPLLPHTNQQNDLEWFNVEASSSIPTSCGGEDHFSDSEIIFMDEDQEQPSSDINKSFLDVGIECEIISLRDLTEAEKKSMVQLDDLRSKLLMKDTEISLLQADMNMLSSDRDQKIVELEDLASQIRNLREENEVSILGIKRIEVELKDLRLRNNELTQEVRDKSDSLKVFQKESSFNEKRCLEMQNRIRDLEVQIKELIKEKSALISEHEAIEVEREEEMRAIQNALDDSLESKIKLQNKFEHDLKVLRNSSSSDEQQLMDDFEWKLRQIESACKTKLMEKDKQMEDKLREARGFAEREVALEKEKLVQERRAVDEQMRQVCHYKAYEAELIQLRGLTHEQQRALRSAARQLDYFKFNEKILHDEIRATHLLLDKEKSHLQMVQRRLEAQEENLHSKLDKLKNELNSKWEDRMRAECGRLEQDLKRLHAEEKHLAVESMKLQKDQEYLSAKQFWERQKEEFQETISELEDSISEKESWSQLEVEKITALAEKEKWDLRRKLEKLTAIHEQEIEKLSESHVKEIDSLELRYEGIFQRLDRAEEKLKKYENDEKVNLVKPSSCQGAERKPSPISISSPVIQSDSGCGDDEDETSEDSQEDEDESEEVENARTDTNNTNETLNLSTPNETVHHLREEVASLQGSIEKLNSELGVQPIEESDESSNETESE